MPSCKDVSRLVSDALDRSLPLAQRVAVRIHLVMCQACDLYSRQIRSLRELLRRYPEQLEPDPAEERRLSLAAKQRMRQAIENASR
jgi:predicted anti-sigma-YlaC factor YlaD